MSLAFRPLIPWRQLTLGSPDAYTRPSEFKVIRRPIEFGGVGTFYPGEVLSDQALNPSVVRIRLRQLYEQRRIEPIHVPDGVGLVARARARAEAATVQPARTPSIQVALLDVDLDPTPYTIITDDHPTLTVGPSFDQSAETLSVPLSAVSTKVKPNFRRVAPSPPSPTTRSE